MDKQWFAIYTSSRKEKKVHERLAEIEVEAFLPLHKTLRQWSDRKKMVEVPLFTSYVFVKINRSEYDKVLQVPGVVCYITFEGKAVAIPQNQIDVLKVLVDSKAEIEATPQKFEPGQMVEVTMGALCRLKGELIETNNNNRLLVRIEHIDQNLLVKVPKAYLHLVN